METPLRDPYIRQGEDASHGIRNMPGSLQLSHALGKRLVPALKIPACPQGKSQESCRCSTSKMVFLGDDIQHLLGISHGLGHLTQSQGQSSPVHGDRSWQTTKLA